MEWRRLRHWLDRKQIYLDANAIRDETKHRRFHFLEKTEAGDRSVKLLPPALEALQAQKAHTYLKGVEIFQRPATGLRWPGDKAIRECFWSSALKRAGVRYRGPYQTRHTFATMMLIAPENPVWVARQMGHTNAVVTM